MYEAIAEDRRVDTITGANAVGIGMGGAPAYQAWLKAQGETTPSRDAAAAQRAAIGRLQRLFESQPNAALRDAVKIN